MAQPTVLLTGCDEGIGEALAQLYAQQRKWNVVAAVRDKTNAESLRALPAVRVVEMDVGDQHSVTHAAVSLSGEPIDVVVNSAARLIRGGLDTVDQHDFMAQLETNTVGPFLVTRALLPNLRLAVERNGFAKVVNLGSRMGCLGENVSGGLYGYRASKAALHMVSKSLAADLKHEKIAVLTVHPGDFATSETCENADMSVRESADKLVKLVDASGLQDTGVLLHVDGSVLDW